MEKVTLTTFEEMENEVAKLLETADKVGASTWQARVKQQTPHCKFGEEGICCRICSMGPCRITPKAPRASAAATPTALPAGTSCGSPPAAPATTPTTAARSATPCTAPLPTATTR